MQRTTLDIEKAQGAIQELTDALEAIRDTLESSTDDVDQQIEDGELDKRDRETAIIELMDGVSENISLLKGQTLDLAEGLGE